VHLNAGAAAAVLQQIGQRLKQSGIHWTVKGADAVAALRCQRTSRPEDQIWSAHRNQTVAA
jgi:hypothetical protein